MTALSQDRRPNRLTGGTVATFPVAAGAVIYGGAAVALDTSGNAVPTSSDSTLLAVGVNTGKKVDNTTGIAGAKSVTVESGVFGFLAASGGVGDVAYFSDDQTINTTSGCYAGVIKQVENGLRFVDINISVKARGGGAITFDTVTCTTSVTSPTLETASGGLSLNPVSGVCTFQKNGSTALTATLDNAGACTLQFAAGATTATISRAQAASGAGGTTNISGQQGAAGSVGGPIVITTGLGGTPGSNLAGGLDIDVGQVVSNTSPDIRVFNSAAQVLNIRRLLVSSLATVDITAGAFATGSPLVLNLTGYGMKIRGQIADVTIDGATNINLTAPFVECSGQLSSATNSVAFSATPTLDCNLSNHHTIGALTANITTLDMSNIRDGAIYTIQVTQDGTGTKTIGWAAKFKFGDTYTNVPKSAANAITVWTFRSDGTNVRCIGKETY